MGKAKLFIVVSSILLVASAGVSRSNAEARPRHLESLVNQEKQPAQDEHQKIPEEEIYWFEPQEVIVEDFKAQGYILAIGGGGEGVIGQLKGQQVIAIDISRRELEGTPAGPLKIVMDARDLKFLDGSFNTAASFFTLMYIKGADHEQVFKEVFRVLTPGGRFMIWDMVFPQCLPPDKKYGAVRLRIRLPEKEIKAGYGVVWPDKVHDLSHYAGLAEATGFKVLSWKEKGQWFYLELAKPY